MTPVEIIKKLSEKDNYELLIWLQWIANKHDCKICLETRKKQSGIPPQCHKCIPSYSLMKKYFGTGV